MQKRFAITITMAVLACGLLVPDMASAGSLGTFCWQLLNANEDVICLNLNDSASQAGIFVAAGTQSTTSYKYPIVGGVSFDERSGSYQMFWTLYATNLSTSGDITFGATLNPTSGSGQWYCGGAGCSRLFGTTNTLGPMQFLGLASTSSLEAKPR